VLLFSNTKKTVDIFIRDGFTDIKLIITIIISYRFDSEFRSENAIAVFYTEVFSLANIKILYTFINKR